MDDSSEGLELICVIVNFGLGSKILKSAKRHGIPGGTIMLGRGTVNNRILDFLGLSDVRKDVIFMAAERQKAYHVLADLNQEYGFDQPNHGIAFTTSICAIFGTKNIVCVSKDQESEAEDTMYHIINIVVDKGKAEEVIAAANEAGSKGGTVVNARGSGIHETSKLFAMEIEPEKEIVIILSEMDKTEGIVSLIRERLKIDEPGNGIIYVQNTNKTCGIYK